MIYGFGFLLFVAPAVLLGLLAQLWIKSSYAKADSIPAKLSGAALAQHMLQANGINNVHIEQVPGQLSDHYDPRNKVLRLSPNVYHGRTLAAVGIAAHEVGHAIQDARNYLPLVIRNAAVPAASFGSNSAFILLMLGMFFTPLRWLMWVGIALFGCVVFFQLVNLPVEFNASSRAKRELVELGVVDAREMGPIRNVLYAAALTYVAATLQSVLTLAYYLMAANRR